MLTQIISNRMWRAILMATLMYASVLQSQAQTDKESFKISIDAPRKVLRSGLPIRIDIVIQNYTDQILLLSGNTGERGSGFIVRDDNGYFPKSLRDIPGAYRSGIGLGVGPYKHLLQAVNFGRFFDMTKPGTYFVEVRKRDPVSKLEIASNTLTITITE